MELFEEMAKATGCRRDDCRLRQSPDPREGERTGNTAATGTHENCDYGTDKVSMIASRDKGS